MFEKETYRRRRAELQGEIDGGLLLFLGNGESPMNYADNCYPFRQDSTFLYYFGIQRPGLVAVIDIDRIQNLRDGLAIKTVGAILCVGLRGFDGLIFVRTGEKSLSPRVIPSKARTVPPPAFMLSAKSWARLCP